MDNINTYYKITWVVDNTSIFDCYKSGETPVYNGTPTKEKDSQNTYTFIGWDKNIVQATSDTTYTAVFEATPIQTSSSSSKPSSSSKSEAISSISSEATSQNNTSQSSSPNATKTNGCGANLSSSGIFGILAVVIISFMYIKRKEN
jgi:hypothetical protein